MRRLLRLFSIGTLPQITVRRKRPVNLLADESLISAEFEKTIPSFHILKLKGVLILDKFILLPYFFGYFDFLSSHGKYSLLEKLKRIRFLRKPSPIIHEACWITDNWTNNYFHWMCDALPRMLAISEVSNCNTVILPEHYLQNNYVTSTLELLSLRPIAISNASANFVKTLYTAEHTAPSGNYYPLIINKLKNVLRSTPEDNEANLLLYVSRSKAGHRKIINESFLIHTITYYGFTVVHFEDYSWEEQRTLLKRCKVLMGIHGAGLTNMLLLPDNAHVVEIRSEMNTHDNCFYSLASELGLNYLLLEATPISHVRNEHFDTTDVHLDEKRLKDFLQTYVPKN